MKVCLTLMALLTVVSCREQRRETAASPTVCSMQLAAEAETVAARASSWNQLQEHFSRFAACDDGAIAEGFSDSATRLLADDWARIGDYDRLVANMPMFEAFVMKHIDESVPKERLRRIIRLATTACPNGLESRCRAIAERAQEAVRAAV